MLPDGLGMDLSHARRPEGVPRRLQLQADRPPHRPPEAAEQLQATRRGARLPSVLSGLNETPGTPSVVGRGVGPPPPTGMGGGGF